MWPRVGVRTDGRRSVRKNSQALLTKRSGTTQSVGARCTCVGSDVGRTHPASRAVEPTPRVLRILFATIHYARTLSAPENRSTHAALAAANGTPAPRRPTAASFAATEIGVFTASCNADPKLVSIRAWLDKELVESEPAWIDLERQLRATAHGRSLAGSFRAHVQAARGAPKDGRMW